jgi:hypothetical protein
MGFTDSNYIIDLAIVFLSKKTSVSRHHIYKKLRAMGLSLIMNATVLKKILFCQI